MPYLFNGKELDSETGLYYYGTRYYDPKVMDIKHINYQLQIKQDDIYTILNLNRIPF